MMMTKQRVGVLMGGVSSEREVSLATGKGVLAALEQLGHDAVALDWTSDQSVARLVEDARVDTVWIALHGTWGEDGCVQGLLECLRVPYTGSGVLPSALAMDKLASKHVFGEYGIATPEHAVYSGDDDGPWRDWGWPLVVKPSRDGSSVGVSLVQDVSGMQAAVDTARGCRGQVLVERYIPGLEIHVAVLDGKVLGTVEVRTPAQFYDYEAKYKRDDTEYLVPAPVADDVAARCHDIAEESYAAFGCTGHARVDVRVDAGGKPWVLEVNTLPGMTSRSLVPKIARHAGIEYADLVERILRSAGLHE